MRYFNVIKLLIDDGDKEREDMEELEKSIDDDDIDFALIAQVTTNANQETLDLPPGVGGVGGARQQGLLYEDQDIESEKSSEGKRNTNESIKERKTGS